MPILEIISITGINILVLIQFLFAFIRRATTRIGNETFLIYKQGASLDLSSKDLGNDDIKNISKLKFVKSLNLSNNNITDINAMSST